MDLYSEFFKITTLFKKEKVRYAVIGGVALAFHDIPRFTRDIDFLILPAEFEKVKQLLVDLKYVESAEPWNFTKTKLTIHRFVKIKGKEHILVDVLVAGSERHEKVIEQSVAAKSQEGVVNIASRDDLIWLKGVRNSDQDKVDIKNLKNDKD